MGQAFRLPAIDLTETYGYIDNVFGNELDVKLVESLSHATFGLIKSLSLAIHLIGEGLAQGRKMHRRHCIKQKWYARRLVFGRKLWFGEGQRYHDPLWEKMGDRKHI